MRLAVAAAVLSSALLQLANGRRGRKLELAALRDRVKKPDLEIGVISALQIKQKRILQSNHQQERLSQKECDPSLSQDPDIGLLSCGFMEYCQPCDDADLGGTCVEMTSSDYGDSDVDRRIQEDETSNASYWFSSNVESFCYASNCTCSNIDASLYTVSITCEDLWGEYCYVVNTTCGTQINGCLQGSLAVDTTGPGTYTATRCLQNLEPKDATVCYYSSHVNFTTETCSVTLDGERCASCEVVPTPTYYCDENATCYNVTVSCYEFDCTNVAGGWADNSCANYSSFMYDYGCEELSAAPPKASVPQSFMAAAVTVGLILHHM
jgi:hypothetical protein